MLVLSGEPAGSIPATKALIEEQWGAKAADTAGMTEVGTIIMFECDHQPGGAHIIEDHYLEEVIDPATRRAGRLRRGGRARGHLLRARLHPRAALPHARPRRAACPRRRCSCGRTFDIYDGGIRGRVDDMKVVRGTNIYPRAIEEIVAAARTGSRSSRSASTPSAAMRDEIEVLVECARRRREGDPLLTELSRELAEAHEGLRIEVRLAEPGPCRASS